MKLGMAFTAILLATGILPTSAHPRHHHYYQHYAHRHLNPVAESLGMGLAVMLERQNDWPAQPAPVPFGKAVRGVVSTVGQILPHRHDGRPRAWCGWFMRQVRGVADTSYNLAREWAHYGSPAGGPRVGAIVVWPHHVGELESGSCPSGEWMVHSGNDGHAVRTRCRSLRGAIAFRV